MAFLSVMGHSDSALSRLTGLTTAHIADASLRIGIPIRPAPFEIRGVAPSMLASGPALPVRHFGSVDVFLEAIDVAEPGQVMVIDNGGRTDEACVGDLVAIEAMAAGLAGLVVWGAHRDTSELIELGLPVFSMGATPAGPQRLDPRDKDTFSVARVGDSVVVDDSDWVVADTDGVLFVKEARLSDVIGVAEVIRDKERNQASEVRDGRTLREQLRFSEYKRRLAEEPSYTLRQHLIEIGGAIET